jgi:hypothetical protein
VRVDAMKKLQYCHMQKYLVVERPFTCTMMQVKVPPFNTIRVGKNMKGGDHQIFGQIGKKGGDDDHMAIFSIEDDLVSPVPTTTVEATS